MSLDYNIYKTLHILFVMCWMAGLLYLPRLFVYHSLKEVGSDTSETFKIMERRLLRAITIPSMVLSWIFGLILIHYGHWDHSMWLHLKGISMLGLSFLTMFFVKCTHDFNHDKRPFSHVFFRIINEVVTFFMIFAIVMAVIKPFS